MPQTYQVTGVGDNKKVIFTHARDMDGDYPYYGLPTMAELNDVVSLEFPEVPLERVKIHGNEGRLLIFTDQATG